MACAAALGLLSLMTIDGVQSQLARDVAKTKYRPRMGGPTMAQQVEQMQNFVNVLQDLVQYKSANTNEGAPDGKRFSSNTGDHTFQFIKGRYGDFLQCQTCKFAVDQVNGVVSNPLIMSMIETAGISACSAYLSWATCSGFVNQFADLIINNLLLLNLQSNYFCNEVYDTCPSWDSNYIELDPENYVDAMLSDKPTLVQNDDFIDNLYKEIAADPNREQRPILKFVHFTDIHMDLKYRAGSSKKCTDVICCRASNGFPTDPAE